MDELVAFFIEAVQEDVDIGEILIVTETKGQFSFVKDGIEYVCTIAPFEN